MQRLIYSKHSPHDRCGVAYFASMLASQLAARHVHGFHGFGRCDEFYINMDIWELSEGEVHSLLNFIASGSAGRTVLLMHDYRFSYLEDQLIEVCDVVINLSGEPALNGIAPVKTMQLFTPSLINPPLLGLVKQHSRPISLTFGFFTPRKKSFKKYLAFYEYMITHHPGWYHIVVASAHSGSDTADSDSLRRLLDSPSVLVMDFLPNPMIAELIHVADIGVCYYPGGIMVNNAAPMSFFQQGKTVVTTYGELTHPEYRSFTLDGSDLSAIDFSDASLIERLGQRARAYHEANLSWDVFVRHLLGTIVG